MAYVTLNRENGDRESVEHRQRLDQIEFLGDAIRTVRDESEAVPDRTRAHDRHQDK